MKVFIKDIGKPFEIAEGEIFYLVVESKKVFSNVINNFIYDEGSEKEIILSDKTQILDKKKVIDLILNPFTLELNQRKVQNLLYQEVLEHINLNFSSKADRLIIEINDLLKEVSYGIDYPLRIKDEIEFIKLLKPFELGFDFSETKIIEKIKNYMEVVTNYLGEKIFVFINLTTFLEDSEIKELKKIVSYNKLRILIIDNNANEKVINCLNNLILDKDLCLI